MTLATVPEYDSAQTTRKAGHAVVSGAGMAGLLAARVLADHFEQVTIAEKDSLPDSPVTRKGVPQANHIHNLHEAGRKTLEDLFPGFSEDLIAAGGNRIDINSDSRVFIEEDVLAHGSGQIPMYCASRPLFELVTRRRVDDIDNISLRENCQFIDYLVGAAPNVKGISVRHDGGTDEIPADLVVDATGRASRTPGWLAEHDYPTPTVDEVHIDVAYSTALVNRPADAQQTRVVLPNPPRKRGGGMFPVENGRWMMTLFGVHGEHAPPEPEGFADFAASLPVHDFKRVIGDHGLASETIEQYPFPSNKRVRYERIDRIPDGLVVIGDGIASFNPIYGQGMSVAALEALQLHHALAADGTDDLAHRFFQRAETVVDDAWMLAVGSDFQFPQTTGPKPNGTDLINMYLSRLLRKARTDGKLADAFNRVIVMEERPTSLFRPEILWRVLTPSI
ncbi:FAD-dependent oxidoreductase [Natronoarchaeum rubrum]|uniref:FAD-dependent oxidoreductase n=1 Tax=Natronoarchaeum rubrum TaxID=755311 RepID=UPI00211340E2|nr:FAD-dependent monooxygenase [Natronoarchaeum rubrum]